MCGIDAAIMLWRKRKTRNKVFVIGRNKTGTTSLAEALVMLGYQLGNQAEAELLIDDWASRRFDRIIKYCNKADAFQDIPFGNADTYKALDQAFPNAKFILSIRSNAEEWYESVTRFHTKIVGKGRLPTAEDLKTFDYREPGWLWRSQQLVYGINENTLYDQKIYIAHYEQHNQKVQEYFSGRPDDLLVLNLASSDAMKALTSFLELPETTMSMPHLNKS